MKKTIAVFVITAFFTFLGTGLSAQDKDPVKKVLGNGTVVINTTTLCEDVEGYMGPTPVEIRIRKDTIIDIIALPNEETPKYFYEASKIFKKWIGLTPAKALEVNVDAVSGATFSSEALIENVQTGLKKAVEK